MFPRLRATKRASFRPDDQSGNSQKFPFRNADDDIIRSINLKKSWGGSRFLHIPKSDDDFPCLFPCFFPIAGMGNLREGAGGHGTPTHEVQAPPHEARNPRDGWDGPRREGDRGVQGAAECARGLETAVVESRAVATLQALSLPQPRVA